MTDEAKYLNINEAAKALGVNRRRVREMIQAGELEAVTNPLDRRQRLVPRTEIERFADFVSASKKAVA